jgi:amino acid permease
VIYESVSSFFAFIVVVTVMICVIRAMFEMIIRVRAVCSLGRFSAVVVTRMICVIGAMFMMIIRVQAVRGVGRFIAVVVTRMRVTLLCIAAPTKDQKRQEYEQDSCS